MRTTKVAERVQMPEPEFLRPLRQDGTPRSKVKDLKPAVTKKGKLKEDLFVKAYIGECRGNAAQAAIKAGYSVKGAKVTGSRILTKPNVKAAVEEDRRSAAEKLGITHEWILNEYKAVAALNGERFSLPKLAALEQLAKHVGLDGIGVVKTDNKNANTGPPAVVQIHFTKTDLRIGDPDYAMEQIDATE